MNLMLLASVAVILRPYRIQERSHQKCGKCSGHSRSGDPDKCAESVCKPVPLSAYTTQRHREAEGGAEHRSGRYQ